MDLSSKDMKQLRGLAHNLQPVVLIGKAGITDNLVAELQRALDSHELVKVRFVEHKEQRRAMSQDLARRAEALEAGMIGHTLILYRQNPNPKKRQIVLTSDVS